MASSVKALGEAAAMKTLRFRTGCWTCLRHFWFARFLAVRCSTFARTPSNSLAALSELVAAGKLESLVVVVAPVVVFVRWNAPAAVESRFRIFFRFARFAFGRWQVDWSGEHTHTAAAAKHWPNTVYVGSESVRCSDHRASASSRNESKC